MTIRFVSGIDVQVELAADAAERARRLRLLQGALLDARSLEELLVDRAGRAGGEAAAAELALGVEPALAPRRHDPSLRPAALERERRALHHLLRVAHAAVAEDARVRLVAHQLVPVRVRLALRIGEDERRLRAELGGEVGELVRPPAWIGIQVLGQEHLGQRLPQLRHVRVGGDDHAVARRGWRRPAAVAASPRRRRRTSGSRHRARACRRGRASG